MDNDVKNTDEQNDKMDKSIKQRIMAIITLAETVHLLAKGLEQDIIKGESIPRKGFTLEYKNKSPQIQFM